MKKPGKMYRILSLLIVVVMLVAVTACGKDTASQETTSPSTTTSTETAQTTEAVKEPVTLTLLVTGTTVEDWNNAHESAVQQEIKKVTGVTLEQRSVSEDQFNVILASGDLPELVRFDQTKHRKALIEGNHLLAMDELLQTNGQDILKNIPATVEYSKLNWSEGKNKVYSIPTQVGPDALSTGINDTISPVLRWDYYKELGYPKFTTEDELLDILKKMQDAHPKTADGKKVYGLSMWNDWGNWMYGMSLYYFTGYAGADSYNKSVEPGSKYIDNTLPDSPYWRTVKFYYNANKMGLLDPDALTMKYADYEAKATSGQILSGPAAWPFQKFNEQNNANKAGYMHIPMESGYQWHGDMANLGWTSKCFGITTDCKTPERAMDLMNYFWSIDGCRTLYNGIKGVNWDVKDGKPTLTDETIAAYKKNDAAWKATSINLDANIIGLAPYFLNSADNEVLCLFNTKQVFSQGLNPLVKDWSDYYQVSYPGEKFANLVKEGKNKDRSGENAFANAYPYNRTDEIKRINGDLTTLMSNHAAKCILAKSDEEFESLKAQAIKDFEKAGSKQNFESRAQWYEEALKDAQKYVK